MNRSRNRRMGGILRGLMFWGLCAVGLVGACTVNVNDPEKEAEQGNNLGPSTEAHPDAAAAGSSGQNNTVDDTQQAQRACEGDADCGDVNPCNGREMCQEGVCLAGEGLVDGATCELPGASEARFCLSRNCVASRCGDGIIEPNAETCDDGNTTDGDGCNTDCTFSCTADAECDDGEECNGEEQCTDEHFCASALSVAPNGITCQDDLDKACRQGLCVGLNCGNGDLDEDEECDDGNATAGDGCDNNCTFSCEEDTECGEGDVCNGIETCNTDGHVCVAGEALDCEDDDDCTFDGCDALLGCQNLLIDEDGDGHAATLLGECGDDCNDDDDEVFLAAPELCDGKDNNCNSVTDEGIPTYYADCDGDGYSTKESDMVESCSLPSPPAKCALGLAATWTLVIPTAGALDCNDENALVNSGQTGFFIDPDKVMAQVWDYNCDGLQTLQYPVAMKGADTSCALTRGDQCVGTPFWSVTAQCGVPETLYQCAFSSGECKRIPSSTIAACH